jgi:hypothetical protein
MTTLTTTRKPPRPVEYDAVRRRLWIFGQRCHHGATGTFVAAAACLGIALERQPTIPLASIIATGGLLMAHDWKDRGLWFRRGYGTQP